MIRDVLPAFQRSALLLDLDGTLIDIAPTPDSVVIPPGLTDTLRSLSDRLDGAVAIVTGRAIDVVDRLLPDTALAIAGEHGGAIRYTQGSSIERPDLPTAPEAWVREAADIVAAWPGSILERKARGFALHYRAVPDAEPTFRLALQAMLATVPGFQMLPGLMLWEVRPIGADKGRAVAELMRRSPFAGRVPVFIGDDVTDEDGMTVARAMGGAGLRVEPAFGSPTQVRAWLHQAAATGNWPDL